MLFPFSDKSRDLQLRLKRFMDTHVHPAEGEFHAWLQQPGKQWTQPPVMEALKEKAKADGLWNLFLPDDAATGEHYGAGLTNLEYAPLAEIMGRSFIGPEVFNCNAPDTGNMEVLVKYGDDTQKKRWLAPLLEGTIRSAFAMTEPEVASSDATNMRATAIVDGNDVVLNGRKWWTSGIGHPHCEILIFMGLTDPAAPRHAQHSMVLVPRNTPGVKVERMLPVFGRLDEPHGHGEVVFDNVRVPKENIIAGPGRGFEIAQGRLGPGRIHHCMRAIGQAEVALELMIKRARSRVAFGKPLYKLNGNPDVIANSRIEINMARLLTLNAAHMMDVGGTFAAMSEISQIKVVAPNVALKVIDAAIQMHGGCGVSDDVPLAAMYSLMRTLRLADGPDEVHRGLIAKFEMKKYG